MNWTRPIIDPVKPRFCTQAVITTGGITQDFPVTVPGLSSPPIAADGCQAYKVDEWLARRDAILMGMGFNRAKLLAQIQANPSLHKYIPNYRNPDGNPDPTNPRDFDRWLVNAARLAKSDGIDLVTVASSQNSQSTAQIAPLTASSLDYLKWGLLAIGAYKLLQKVMSK